MHKDPSKRQPYQRDTISQSCVAGMQAGDSTTRITGLQLEFFFSPPTFQLRATSAFQFSARVTVSMGRQECVVQGHLTSRYSLCSAHQPLQYPATGKVLQECDNSSSARFVVQGKPARGNCCRCCVSSLLIFS
jgi:hypothetical protein